MIKRDVERLLAEHPDFHAFDAAERQKLASHAAEETYVAGTTIFMEDDAADSVMLILEGQVDVQTALTGQTPIVVERLGPGDMLGWSWLLPPFRRMSDALATSDVRVVALDATGVRSLCHVHPDLGYRLYQAWLPHLADRFRAQRLRLLALLAEPRA